MPALLFPEIYTFGIQKAKTNHWWFIVNILEKLCFLMFFSEGNNITIIITTYWIFFLTSQNTSSGIVIEGLLNNWTKKDTVNKKMVYVYIEHPVVEGRYRDQKLQKKKIRVRIKVNDWNACDG